MRRFVFGGPGSVKEVFSTLRSAGYLGLSGHGAGLVTIVGCPVAFDRSKDELVLFELLELLYDIDRADATFIACGRTVVQRIHRHEGIFRLEPEELTFSGIDIAMETVIYPSGEIVVAAVQDPFPQHPVLFRETVVFKLLKPIWPEGGSEPERHEAPGASTGA